MTDSLEERLVMPGEEVVRETKTGLVVGPGLMKEKGERIVRNRSLLRGRWED